MGFFVFNSVEKRSKRETEAESSELANFIFDYDVAAHSAVAEDNLSLADYDVGTVFLFVEIIHIWLIISKQYFIIDLK